MKNQIKLFCLIIITNLIYINLFLGIDQYIR